MADQELGKFQLRRIGTMKLNLGCGYHYPEGWINADVDPGRGDAFILDIDWQAREDPLPWEDATFNQVMLFHVINHVRLEHLDHFLKEVRRVTAPGGGVLVMTQDAQSVMKDLTSLAFTGGGRPWCQESDTSLVDADGYDVMLPILEDDETEGITTISRPVVWGAEVLEHLTQSHALQTPNYWNCYADRNINILKRFFDGAWIVGVDGLDPAMFEHGQHYKSSVSDPIDDPRRRVGGLGPDDQSPGWDWRGKWITDTRTRSADDHRPSESTEPCERHDPKADLFIWTDPATGFEWPIRGMGRRSCLVMATVTSS